MKVFVKFVGSVFFVDLRLSQDPHIPTTLSQIQYFGASFGKIQRS